MRREKEIFSLIFFLPCEVEGVPFSFLLEEHYVLKMSVMSAKFVYKHEDAIVLVK